MRNRDARPLPDPDDALVRRMADGDPHACADLMQRHLDRIHGLAHRLLGNATDADDVAQDTFLRAWQQAPRWQPGRARFGSWMYRVALNLCRDRLRARHPEQALDSEPLADSAASPERLVGQRQLAGRLDAALAKLPTRQREALALFHDHELSQAEIAQALGVSVEAVESLLARGRGNLRRILTEASA